MAGRLAPVFTGPRTPPRIMWGSPLAFSHRGVIASRFRVFWLFWLFWRYGKKPVPAGQAARVAAVRSPGRGRGPPGERPAGRPRFPAGPGQERRRRDPGLDPAAGRRPPAGP